MTNGQLLDTLCKYSAETCDTAGQAAKVLKEKNLYSIESGANRQPGGYTMELDKTDLPFIFITNSEGENVLQITPTSSTSGIDPLRELSGTYYVDPQGVLYKLESDGKASLAYVPPDITEYTVPETITADGTPYTVSRVNPHARRT